MRAEQYFERNNFFERAFARQFNRTEDHQFRGYNRSLGCFVEGKAHYKKLMKQKGLVPFEEAERLATEFDRSRDRKPFDLSPKAMDIIRSIKITADKNGNIRLGDRAINALMSIGAIGNDSKYEPVMR
jgi:hypothetical protein